MNICVPPNPHLYLCTLILLLAGSFAASARTLTLQQAEQLALRNEPGILGLNAKTESMIRQSVAMGELMDPKLQIGLLNLPIDSFDFDQEPMTQFKVSYIQQFPSGDSLELKRDKALSQSQQFQYQLREREKQLLNQVRQAFLETLYWEQARATVQKNHALVDQLADFVQSQFSVGRSSQFDVISVQQRLSKLDDRLHQIEQKVSGQRYRLAQWIDEDPSRGVLSLEPPAFDRSLWSDLAVEQVNRVIAQHPRIREQQNRIEVSRKDLELARESEKPGWNLNVSYAYRDDAPNGSDRADFLSAMVTFDLPLFSENRQRKLQQAQEFQLQSINLQRDALLRQLRSDFLRLRTDLEILDQRDDLYRDTLVPQAAQQSQAALQSYQSGSGSFADVMQAYMEQLNTSLELQRIQTDSLKTQAELLYFVEVNEVTEHSSNLSSLTR